MKLFRDRRDAGQSLSLELESYRELSDLRVVALSAGGTMVGAEISARLNAPLDLLWVKRICVPERENLAIGVAASARSYSLFREIIAHWHIPPAQVTKSLEHTVKELQQERHRLRGGMRERSYLGSNVLLVDDGSASGAEIRIALDEMRRQQPAHLIVALPVASTDACMALKTEVDAVVCLHTPARLEAVEEWYDSYEPVTDKQVQQLLVHAGERRPRGGPAVGTVDEVESLLREVEPFNSHLEACERVLPALGDASYVLIGESTHGTQDFYAARAEITKQLVEHAGISAIAVEADWPDAYRANLYVQGKGEDRDARAALADFQRFPMWMWRNHEVVDFLEWLREFNLSRPNHPPVGFYGLDLYSLFRSIEAVVQYLDRWEPEQAALARARYGCFDAFGRNVYQYGQAAGQQFSPGCEAQVSAQLRALLDTRLTSLSGASREAQFVATQNARLVRNAERYYRAMFRDDVLSWNLRDQHMMDMLDSLQEYLRLTWPRPKVVVWAHNSHLGDARATEMGRCGEWNLGELVRNKAPNDSFLLGMTTYTGTVTAASSWNSPPFYQAIRPALRGSVEELFHRVKLPSFFVNLRRPAAKQELSVTRLERAIGVLYLPQSERRSHYFEARLSEQFDGVLHFDKTEALIPLELLHGMRGRDAPETYPAAV